MNQHAVILTNKEIPMITEQEAALFAFRLVLRILRPDIDKIEQKTKKVVN